MRFLITALFFLSCFLGSQVCAETPSVQGSLSQSLFHPEAFGPAAQVSYQHGFFFKSSNNTLLINGYVQADYRGFLERSTERSDFFIRRGRINFEGTYEDSFRVYISTNWTVPFVNLNKAYIDTLGPEYARFTIGIFNEPFSLEALLPDEAVDFIERTPGTVNFLQTQDTGAMIYGSLLNKRLNYATGVFNGTGHFIATTSNKEFCSRLVFVPFLHTHTMWDQTYIGFSGSTFHQRTDLSDTTFRTGSGSIFWIWRDFVVAHQKYNRWGADIEWFFGPMVIRSEFLHVDWGDVEGFFDPPIFAPFSANSGYIEATYILTGEKKVRNQLVHPFSEVRLGRCGWRGLGAWEATFRYDILDLDPAALDLDLARGTSRIQGIWTGINWYLNQFFLVQVNWAHYHFRNSFFIDDHKISGENVILFRFQGLF